MQICQSSHPFSWTPLLRLIYAEIALGVVNFTEFHHEYHSEDRRYRGRGGLVAVLVVALTGVMQMARTQKNKATSRHLGLLKAKLAKLRHELMDPAGGGGGGKQEGLRL